MTQTGFDDFTDDETDSTETDADEAETVERYEPDGGRGLKYVETASKRPANVHADFSELDELPEDVPVCAAAADVELAKRAVRKAVSEHGHHDPARSAFVAFWRDRRDDSETFYEAACTANPDTFAFGRVTGKGDVSTGTMAAAILEWMAHEMAEALDRARTEYCEHIREMCERALGEQREREKDAEFSQDPPEEVNGWERFESDKDDVVAAYRAVNYGTPSVVAIYETADGLDAHESTLENWNVADTAADAKVNRHMVRSTETDLDVWGSLRSHLNRFDGHAIETAPAARADFERTISTATLPDLEPKEFDAVTAYANDAGEYVAVGDDGEGGYIVAWLEAYESHDGETKISQTHIYAADYRSPFASRDGHSGILTNAREVGQIVTGIMEHGGIREFNEAEGHLATNPGEPHDEADDIEPLSMETPEGWDIESHMMGGNVDIDGHRETARFERDDGASVSVEMREDSYTGSGYVVNSSFIGVPQVNGVLDRGLTRLEAYETAREHMADHMIDTETDDEPTAEPTPDAGAESQPVETDGGQPVETDDDGADELDLPENETVRLISTITRVMNSPTIVEGETSGTGKTISAPEPYRDDSTVRLDTESILRGESEFRDSRSYEIYTPGRFRARQRSNHAPGPQAGANEISDADDLPEPTHWPVSEQAEWAPENCPECDSTAPYDVMGDSVARCEACGETVERGDDEEAADETDDGADKWDLSQYARGDVLALDAYAGRWVVWNRNTDQFGTVLALDVVSDADEVMRLRKTNMMGPRFHAKHGEIEGGRFREAGGRSIMVNVDEMDDVQDFEKVDEDEQRLREIIRTHYYDRPADDDDEDDDGHTLMTDGGRDLDDGGDDETETHVPDDDAVIITDGGQPEATDEEVEEAIKEADSEDETMEEKPITDGGELRFGEEDALSLAEAKEAKDDGARVRISRDLVEVNETGSPGARKKKDVDGVEALLFASDFNSHIQQAIVFDSESDLYAVVSGHTRQEAWNLAEHDWKVRSVGSGLTAEVTAGEFETDADRDGWARWVLDEVVDWGESGAVWAVKPDGSAFEIVIDDSNISGLVGDRFSLNITAADAEDDE